MVNFMVRIKRPWRTRVPAALAVVALAAAILLWLDYLPFSSAAAAPDEIDRGFDKLGIIKIRRLPPPEDFTLADLNGRQVRLSDFKGKVVFLNFWTTWCPQCRLEMPALEKLHQRFKDRAFVMLAVSLRERKSTVEQFFERQRLNYTALLDSDGRVGLKFGIRSIPTSIIIDRRGAMIAKAIGSRPWDSDAAMALFERLIDNPPDRRVTSAKEN
jgi:peroxiredoxin